jgi:hypothetical protein
VLGAAPDGSVYLRVRAERPGTFDPKVTYQVRSTEGSYLPVPPAMIDEGIFAMAFDATTGDPYVLSFPENRGHLRRFRGEQVEEDVALSKPDGTPLTYTGDPHPEVYTPDGSDLVQLFYDSSTRSVLYANGGELFRIDAQGAMTVLRSRPVPRTKENHVAYAVDSKTGRLFVAFEEPTVPPACSYGYAIYRIEAKGSLTRLAGGVCDKGKNSRDRATPGGVDGMAFDSGSGALFWWSLWGGLQRFVDGEVTTTKNELLARQAVIDGTGDVYVSLGPEAVKVTFPKS